MRDLVTGNAHQLNHLTVKLTLTAVLTKDSYVTPRSCKQRLEAIIVITHYRFCRSHGLFITHLLSTSWCVVYQGHWCRCIKLSKVGVKWTSFLQQKNFTREHFKKHNKSAKWIISLIKGNSYITCI